MMVFIVVIHVIVCILLILIILIQAGRGGGLVDNFSSIENVLGTKTNAFFTRATTVLSTLFFITCLTLAFMSLKQSKSLMSGVKDVKAQAAVNQTINDTSAKPIQAETTNQTK